MEKIWRMNLNIRNTTESDLHDVLNIHTQAFGNEKGPVIADLVDGLLVDPTARPLLSLLAVENDRPLGHILFTKTRLTDSAESVSSAILAPLAILPEVQSQGIGGRLIDKGLKRLSESGVELVFVLGHPGYYPRHGFHPVGSHGFEAPYPIPDEVSDAWMVQELRPGIIGKVKGKVICSEVLNQPEHWRE